MKNNVKLDGLERQRMAMGIVAVEIVFDRGCQALRSLVPNHVGVRLEICLLTVSACFQRVSPRVRGKEQTNKSTAIKYGPIGNGSS